MNERKIIISAVIFIIVVAAAGTIELPLPNGIAKDSVITATIESCDLQKSTGGKTSSPNFVGFYFNDDNAPYIRRNPVNDEFKAISVLCKNKSNVRIWYKAKRLIIRPKVTYWLGKYKVLGI
jgi:hypothetical protein